ncbi:ribulokinase [Brevibacillus sp. TJ4]|uniref:FGGY-family carbohydrate kinase n=1 Tax=Brevibacillus sp. TJ4 TaxID=3234853 RepID=UPI0037D0A4DF
MFADKPCVMGIDFGTQGLKAGIFTTDGKLVWKSERSYPTVYPQVGRAEQEPLDWWQALREVLKSASDNIDLRQIDGIAVCATSSTVLHTDAQGVPRRPAILWMDQRAVAEMEEINANRQQDVQEVLQYAGGKVSEEWMTAKTLWLKRHAELKPGDKIVEQLDWLHYQLTGVWAASMCNAVCKWNYVKSGGGFSPDYFAAIGLSDYAAYWPDRVVPVGGQVGTLTDKAAQELGLPAGTPVFQGGIDAHIGMLGVGAVDTGVMSLVMGSSFVHLVHADRPVFHPGLWGPYQDAILPQSWLIEGGQLTCGSLTTWFLQQFYPHVPEGQRDEVYAELLREAGKLPPGSEGIVIMDSWQGNRTPYRDPLATGAVVGLTLAHNRYHLFRGMLESTAYGTRNIIETFQESGLAIHRIIACGGGTKNPLWMQILSDVTGLVIETLEETEAGIKGCAMIASYGLGHYGELSAAAKAMVEPGSIYTPQQSNKQLYDKYFDMYLELHKALLPVMHNLTAK